MCNWKQVNELRWARCDGAVVRWDQSSPHPNPENPRSLMWTAWEPDPSEKYLIRVYRKGKRRSPLRGPRRFKTPEAAMRAVDEMFPIGETVSGEEDYAE